MKKLAVNKILISLLTLTTLVLNGYLIYMIFLFNGIENIGRYLVISIFFLIDLYIFLSYSEILKTKKRHQSYKLYYILISLFLIINIIGSLGVRKVYKTIDSVNKNEATYTTYLVSLKDVKLSSLNKIGIIEDESSIEGYIISQNIIKEENLSNKKLEKYSTYPDLISALYEKKVEAIFISSDYVSKFNTIEEYKNIENDTTILLERSENHKKETTTSNKSVTEPFTVLLMGVDSEKEGLSSTDASNGDALILLTFNPDTLNITMVSIPRDSYVPIACFANQKENKITHAAWNGSKCMVDTIQNYFDIKIDYYVKINFKGVVGLVDALGGIEIDVPKKLCTGDSDRKKDICLNPGKQLLNGEQALAFARNRKMLSDGDFGREQNQQKVILSMLESAKKIQSVDQVSKILTTISNNIDTNFSNNQILSFYNLFKNIVINGNKDLQVDQMLLTGTGQEIYDEGMQLVLWNYVLNKNSVNDIKQAMKINLNIENPSLIKEFSYNPEEPYTKTKIGSGPYSNNSTYSLLPNFKNYTLNSAINWLNNNNFTVNYKYTEGPLENSDTAILSQSIPAKKRMDLITSKSITLTVYKYVPSEVSEDINEETGEEIIEE